MAFPKKSKTIDDSQIKITHKYLAKQFDLMLDRLKCTGCGQCSTVCPKDAILFGPAAAVYENKPKDLNAAVVDTVDPEKCVMCGTCVVFCPFDAIQLFEDGEEVKTETMHIVAQNALPKLTMKETHCSKLARDGHIYWEGKIEVTYEMHTDKEEFRKYYMNKCPGDCHKCEQICPTEAISFPEFETAWESKVLIEVDEEKCVTCSACQNVCPQDNFKVWWTKINTTGPYNQIFWDPIRAKLLKQEVTLTPEE
ncbi:MAG: 4Fe-4S binding protein [Promethearchaeota archaeon]